MYTNTDFSEQPKNCAAGVLPTRHSGEYCRTLRPSDPALRAMTDFTRKIAITVEPEKRIDAALADMVRLSVRALLVVRGASVIGLITSYNIDGRRAERFAEQYQVARPNITVGDIMTEWEDLPTLDWHTLQTTRISDLLEIFEGIGVMHLLVIENDERGAEVLRGLISRSRIERQLRDDPDAVQPPVENSGCSVMPPSTNAHRNCPVLDDRTSVM